MCIVIINVYNVLMNVCNMAIDVYSVVFSVCRVVICVYSLVISLEPRTTIASVRKKGKKTNLSINCLCLKQSKSHIYDIS